MTVSSQSHEATERQTWDGHWRLLSRRGSVVGAIASLVRRWLLRPTVARHARRHFAAAGVFVEAGCGTSEASLGVDRNGRTTVGLDFSLTALVLAKHGGLFDGLVCSDIRLLPFRDTCVAGVWNLGVMEHFEPATCSVILREFKRVLEVERGRAILFWPPTFGLSRWVLAPFELVRGLLAGKRFRFYPDEVNRLPSKRAAYEAFEEAGLETCAVHFGPSDGFNHLIVIGKPRQR